MVEDVDSIQIGDVDCVDEGLEDVGYVDVAHVEDVVCICNLDVNLRNYHDEVDGNEVEVESRKDAGEANAVVECEEVIGQRNLVVVDVLCPRASGSS